MSLENLLKFIDPALLVLMPTLWGIGMLIKRSAIKNRFIPLILMICSCVLSAMYLSSTRLIFDYMDFMSWLFSSFTQGCIIWLITWICYEKFIKEKSDNQNNSQANK